MGVMRIQTLPISMRTCSSIVLQRVLPAGLFIGLLAGCAAPIGADRVTVRQAYAQVGTNALLRQMIVIGHSQGGLLTKLTATSTGDRMWRAFSDKPIEEFPIAEAQRAQLRHLLFLEPLPFVRRVIFISTPHRGSYLASSFARRLAAKLMSLPSATVEVTRNSTSMFKGTSVGRLLEGRLPTSLDGMSPKNPVLLAVADIPVAPTIQAHSIIPVKGDGDLSRGRDGVVAYTSAHVSYVESEFVVRSGHSCLDQPSTIQEVRRILHKHLQELK